MAESNLIAAQRRASAIADRIDGAALCIADAMKELDTATRHPFLRSGHVSNQIKRAMICAYDALTLVRPCVPAKRRAEIKRAMRCLDGVRA